MHLKYPMDILTCWADVEVSFLESGTFLFTKISCSFLSIAIDVTPVVVIPQTE